MTNLKWEILFTLGDIRVTPGVRNALEESAQEPIEFLMRHVTGDWGQVTAQEKEDNNRALAGGKSIASAYDTAEGVRIWVITEYDHSSTTLTTPLEY
jgi:hypothetical protein